MYDDYYGRLKRRFFRKKKGSPALVVAIQIVNGIFPDGIPDETRDRDLFAAAQRYCSEKKMTCPSDTHLLRAAGRRK
jgi:hypothetical protein